MAAPAAAPRSRSRAPPRAPPRRRAGKSWRRASSAPAACLRARTPPQSAAALDRCVKRGHVARPRGCQAGAARQQRAHGLGLIAHCRHVERHGPSAHRPGAHVHVHHAVAKMRAMSGAPASAAASTCSTTRLVAPHVGAQRARLRARRQRRVKHHAAQAHLSQAASNDGGVPSHLTHKNTQSSRNNALLTQLTDLRRAHANRPHKSSMPQDAITDSPALTL